MHGWLACGLLCLALMAVGCSRSEVTPASAADAVRSARVLPAGSDIIARFATQDFCKDVTATMEVTIDGDTSSAPIRIRMQRKRADGVVATLMQVLSPAEEKGKVLLSRAEAGKWPESFAYLPGLKKIASFPPSREVAIGNVHVTIQEMLRLELELYSHEVAGESQFEDIPVYEIRSTADRSVNTCYCMIRGLFRKDNHMPVEITLYSQTGELAKRIRFPKISQRQGYWTADETTIEDAAQKQVVRLKMLDIKYDQNLPDSIFTEENLLKLVGQPVTQVAR